MRRVVGDEVEEVSKSTLGKAMLSEEHGFYSDCN
jgi:hypothetical protein